MKDLAGNELKVGDRIVMTWPEGCELLFGEVTRFTSKRVCIKVDLGGRYWPEQQRKSNGVLKV